MKKFFYIPITHNANCSLGLFFVQFLSKEIYNYYNKNPFYNLGISHWKQIPKLNSKLESDFFFNQPKGYDICEKILKEKGTFKFLFCRNPWDRLVSCYEYAKAEKSYWHNNVGEELTPHPDFELIKRISFEETVDILYKYRGHRILKHAGWLPQVHWLWNDSIKKEFIVDKIYRIEDLSSLEKRFDVKLKKINVTKKKPYKEYYTPELIDKVSQIYEQDIKTLKYEF